MDRLKKVDLPPPPSQLLVQFHEENEQQYLNPYHRWLLEVSTPTVHDRQQTYHYHRRRDNQHLEFEESRQCLVRASESILLFSNVVILQWS